MSAKKCLEGVLQICEQAEGANQELICLAMGMIKVMVAQELDNITNSEKEEIIKSNGETKT